MSNEIFLSNKKSNLIYNCRDPTIPVEMDPCYSWTFIESFWFVSSDRSSCSDDGLSYIYISIRPIFQIFTQSIDAIDVTSVTRRLRLNCLNSINAIDFTRYLGDIFGIYLEYLQVIFGMSLGYIWDIFGISLGYLWDIFGISLGYL